MEVPHQAVHYSKFLGWLFLGVFLATNLIGIGIWVGFMRNQIDINTRSITKNQAAIRNNKNSISSLKTTIGTRLDQLTTASELAHQARLYDEELLKRIADKVGAGND